MAVATWAVSLNAAFFALDKVSPVGSRPVLVLIGLVITVVLTWVLMRRRVRGLPSGVARNVMRRGMIVALFSGALTYFVLMQIVMPLLFLFFGVSMGGLFPGQPS